MLDRQEKEYIREKKKKKKKKKKEKRKHSYLIMLPAQQKENIEKVSSECHNQRSQLSTGTKSCFVVKKFNGIRRSSTES